MASSTDTHRLTIETHADKGAILDIERTDWGGMAGFEPPDDGTWMRYTVLWGDAFEETISDAAGENTLIGILEAQFFGPEGEGYGQLTKLVDTFRTRFNRIDLTGGIAFGAPSPGRRVPNRDGWLQMNVSAPFEVSETVT